MDNIKLDNYSWKGAFAWGYCGKHLKAGFSKNEGTKAGGRAIHIVIGLVEALPIIGQVVSVAEKFIATKSKEKSNPQAKATLNPSSAQAEIVPKIATVARTKIRENIQGILAHEDSTALEPKINKIVEIIEEIVKHSTVIGRNITFDEDGVAYIRKDEQIPFTLEAHRDGAVYVHFKSSSQQNLLGQACQKKVFRAIDQGGEVVAACVIHESGLGVDSETFEIEKAAIEKFRGCKYVLQGFHATKYRDKRNEEMKYGLITEYCNGDADSDFLDTLEPQERIRFFLKVLEGVAEMHRVGYSHCDIKGDNIMYKKVEGGYEPRIIDFGVMLPLNQTLEHGIRGGVLPPEMRIHEYFPQTLTDKVDVWALGWYAATEILHLELEQTSEIILNEAGEYAGKKGVLKIEGLPPEEMEDFYEIVMQMLNCDPNERISLTSAIELLTSYLAEAH